jgi:membrane fusion protein, multidrug efflux system
MRLFFIILAIVGLLALGKIYLFKKPENQNGGPPAAAMTDKKGKDDKGGSKPPSPPIAVDVAVAKLESVENNITSSGTITPNEEVELRAETSGRLIDLRIAEGSVVKKGQLIAKLKDDDLQAQLKKIQFEETLAKKLEERQKKLLEINAISKEEYDITANKLNTIGADIELLKVNLAKTVVTAPFSGRIGFKSVSEGAYLSPATTIATLVQTNPVKIDFTVPEKYSSLIRIGKMVKFTLDGMTINTTIPAKIVAIDPKIDPSLRTLKIRAVAVNPAGRLIPGMFVKVDLNLEATRSIMIPTEAIVPVLKGKKVFVVQEGKATEKMIETGVRNDKNIQILSGLNVGDSLIVSGLMAVKKDSKVKVKKKN